jgi:hypothetical protein
MARELTTNDRSCLKTGREIKSVSLLKWADSVDKVFCGPKIVRLSERSRTHSKGNQ